MNKKICEKMHNGMMNYFVSYPDNYEDLPLLVYLHGAGERGTNIEHIDRHGVPELLKNGAEINAVVLCPQCPAEYVWDNVVANLKIIIDRTVQEYGIKKDRICITGSSMGGFGCFMMGLTYPNFFSGIAPVAGGGMSWRCENLKTTPVYAFHGEADSTVPAEYSKLMVNSVNEKGGNARLVLLPNLDHNDGIDYAYAKTDILEWLLSCRRTTTVTVKEILHEMF